MKANFSRQVHVGGMGEKRPDEWGGLRAYGALEIRQMLCAEIGTLLSIKWKAEREREGGRQL